MTAPAGEAVFDLALTTEEYLPYYRGTARDVRVRARDGRVVQFPASLLRPFVVADGVHGCFRLCFDEHNRLVSLERVANG